MAAAVLILVYLSIPAPSALLAGVGFAYGFCFVASGIWGPVFHGAVSCPPARDGRIDLQLGAGGVLLRRADLGRHR
jgi:hypothetical protein